MTRRLVLAALLLVAGRPRGAAAHELGTIRVVARFEKGGRYAIDAIVDREHLPPGFGAGASIDPRWRPVENLDADLERRVGGLVGAAIDGVRIAFDGVPARPRVALVLPEAGAAAAADAPELTLRFSGDVPAGARVFTWTNAGSVGTYMLTIRTEGEAQAARQWIEGAAGSRPFTLAAGIAPVSRLDVVRTYLALGFTHILPKGTDHILFVLGLFLLAVRWKPVLLQVSAFTVAHTITLALTIYGVVSLSPRIVEPLIALSIVYVAVENVVTPALTPWRVALVFGFGLLHGMGFAGVLSQLGLPRAEFVPALLSFNAGVELGQLTVIAVAFLLVGLPFGRQPWYRRRVVIPGSIAIAAVGLCWFVQRIRA
ncbi:MAG TPA: HupE/UreJ family protein [Thermoanaerobaculia bacterium]|nr:HupE/UreJ family protein [Thermoanaerobaculia bacterium]